MYDLNNVFAHTHSVYKPSYIMHIRVPLTILTDEEVFGFFKRSEYKYRRTHSDTRIQSDEERVKVDALNAKI